MNVVCVWNRPVLLIIVNALSFIMGYSWLPWKYVLCYFYWCSFLHDTYHRSNQLLENMQKSYVLFDVTWRKNGSSCGMRTLTLLIGILIRNILKPTRNLYAFRFKCYCSNSGFRVFGDLDRDLWPVFYFLSHALRIIYWNIYAQFHKNPSSMNGWFVVVKVLKNALCFIMWYLVAMEIRVTLFLLVRFLYDA